MSLRDSQGQSIALASASKLAALILNATREEIGLARLMGMMHMEVAAAEQRVGHARGASGLMPAVPAGDTDEYAEFQAEVSNEHLALQPSRACAVPQASDNMRASAASDHHLSSL